MGIALFVLSNVLGLVLLPLGVLYGFCRSFYRHHFDTGLALLNKKLVHLATALDKYGNVVCAEIFNDALIKKTSRHHFGDISQTISMVVGYNLKAGTLTWTGKLLNRILDFVDPGHALKAIGEQ